MKIADGLAFRDHRKNFSIELKEGNGVFTVALNFSTGLYFKINALQAEMQSMQESELAYFLAEIVADLLNSVSGSYSADWVIENIPEAEQTKFLGEICSLVSELITDDRLKVPEIEPKNKPARVDPKNKAAKEMQETRNQIARAVKVLQGKADVYLADELTLLLTKTQNSYFEIMDMPILVYKDLIRSVSINELRSDENWYLAYLMEEIKRLQIDFAKEARKKPEVPKRKRGATLKGLIVE